MQLEPIAIVGAAGRFPLAEDIETLWLNLREGKDCITRLSEDQLEAAGVTAAEYGDSAYVRANPLMPGVDHFDADIFKISHRDALIRDPQQRIFLETAYQAVEDSGRNPWKVPGAVGVFAGAATNGYAEFNLRKNKAVASRLEDLGVAIGNHTDYVASSVAYQFGYVGPAISLATACSTSLVAVHIACSALRCGEVDVALAGGVNVEMPYGRGYRWLPGSIVSRDGVSRPFDAGATGAVFGNGAGIVVLKRLSDALLDHDNVRALIISSAVNNDGSEKVSFGAPSIKGQSMVIAEAMALANLTARDIGYVEAHGTGTVVGDPLEIAALAAAYEEPSEHRCDVMGAIPVGSVKSNVGHLGAAAGITGLIKAMLCLENETIVPSINYHTPNPKLKLDDTRFRIASELNAWPRKEGERRRAAVSSFGVGGTNAHVILEESPRLERATGARAPVIVLRSAASEESLRRYEGSWGRRLDLDAHLDPRDVAFTTQRSRGHFRYRHASVVEDLAELRTELQASQSTRLQSPSIRPPGVGFLFPGQGSQQPAMARGLYQEDSLFRCEMDKLLGYAGPGQSRLRELWANGSDIDDTALAQPLLFTVELALARSLIALGVVPGVVVGHSLGELTAACVAGVMSDKDGMQLVQVRSDAMQALPRGGMLAVASSPEEIEDLIPQTVSLAAVNGDRQTVLSGPTVDLQGLGQALTERGIAIRMLNTSHAFHSKEMLPAADAMARKLGEIELTPASIRMLSAATGSELPAHLAQSRSFWAMQVVQPVVFGRALDSLLNTDSTLLLELGPGRALAGMVRKHPRHSPETHPLLSVLPPRRGADRDDALEWSRAIATIWLMGWDISWERLPSSEARTVSLPPYQFSGARYWVDPDVVEEVRTTPSSTEVVAALRGAGRGDRNLGVASDDPRSGEPRSTATSEPFSEIAWRMADVRVADKRRERDVALVLLPSDEVTAPRVMAWLRKAGYRAVSISDGGAWTHSGHRYTVPSDAWAEGVRKVLEGLSDEEWPRVLVDAAGLAPEPPADTGNVDGLVDKLVLRAVVAWQQATRLRGSRPQPDFLALTIDALDVSGSEDVHPVKAMMVGIVKTMGLEERGGRSGVLDISRVTAEGAIIQELSAPISEPVVALRGERRWLPYERSISLIKGDLRIRPRGTYLITGGLGAIGLAVAGELVDTGAKPTLVLLSRRRFPWNEDESRDTMDSARDDSEIRTTLEGLRQSGAAVEIVQADVGDMQSMGSTIEKVVSRFGPLHGVLHAAGIAGGGILSLRSLDDIREVLRPKVRGTLALEEALKGCPTLDFFLHFSSRAAATGLVGSGDYAAANCFLDARTRCSAVEHPTISVAWPSWAGGGMSALASADERIRSVLEGGSGQPKTWSRTVSPENYWPLDEHRFVGQPVMPGTAFLDLVLQAFTETVHTGLPGVIILRDVVFVEPLVAINGPTEILIEFTPLDDSWNVSVRSHDLDGRRPTATHVRAQIHTSERALARRDVSQIAPTFEQPAAASMGGGLMEFGPRWACAILALQVTDSDREFELALPSEFQREVDEHSLHPALLDNATSLVQAGVPGTHLPFSYDEIAIAGRLPARIVCSVKIRTVTSNAVVGDIRIWTPGGDPVLEISGFAMRPANGESFRNAGGQASEREGAVAEPYRKPSDGVPPRLGARLAVEVISSSARRTILVRPYRHGGFVPLEASSELSNLGQSVPAPLDGLPAAFDGINAISAPPPPPPFEPVRAARHVEVEGNALGAGDEARTDGDAIEKAILRMLRETLGQDDATATDDFFDLGGDSLSAISLMSAIRDEFGVDLSIGLLFERSTARDLADAVRRK